MTPHPMTPSPPAAKLRLATVWLAGWVVMTGAEGAGVTVSVAALLLAVP